MNLRPSGYEPDELPAAPSRDVIIQNSGHLSAESGHYKFHITGSYLSSQDKLPTKFRVYRAGISLILLPQLRLTFMQPRRNSGHLSAESGHQAASNQVLSAYKGLTTVFGMGTGGSP